MPGWYSEDEEEIAAVHELEGSSDRTSAIVATSLIELRLTEFILRRLAKEPKITGELFRTSGPLGNLSTKIDLALLIGLVSKEAHRDLVILKNIRNEFAHSLKSTSFDVQRIRNWCENLKLVETMIRPMGDDTWHPGARFMLNMTGYPECLNTPKGRFLTTARLYVAAFSPRMEAFSIDTSFPNI